MGFTGYLNTPEGKRRFPKGRFFPDKEYRYEEVLTSGDMEILTDYLRLKEPWRYEE